MRRWHPCRYSFPSFHASRSSRSVALALAARRVRRRKEARRAAPDHDTEGLAVKTSVLKVGSVDVEERRAPQPDRHGDAKAVLGVAQTYIDNAVFAPLKTGKLGAGYAALFDPA